MTKQQVFGMAIAIGGLCLTLTLIRLVKFVGEPRDPWDATLLVVGCVVVVMAIVLAIVTRPPRVPASPGSQSARFAAWITLLVAAVGLLATAVAQSVDGRIATGVSTVCFALVALIFFRKAGAGRKETTGVDRSKGCRPHKGESASTLRNPSEK